MCKGYKSLFLLFKYYRSTANGTCLYNSGSIASIGSEEIAFPLRILTIFELYENANYYADHPILLQAEKNGPFYSSKTPLSITVSDEALDVFDRKLNNKVDCMREEAKLLSNPTEYSSFSCMLAMSSVLGMPIYSHYPLVGNDNIEEYLNTKIYPRTDSSIDKTIHIIWTRAGNFDNRPNYRFEPNHFVPLVLNQ